jgi:ATP-dependent helicase YprA (DUF1998 family)
VTESKIYSVRNVFEGLKKTFHQYLEAQYHIWDEGLIAERQRLLNQPGVCFQEPLLEATPSYTIGKSYQQLNIPQPAREILSLASNRPNVGIYREPYHHQAEALERFLGNDEEIIVATGTGSGKTESFLMPILGTLAIESVQRSKSWKTPGCRALLLYPMNALVNDQLARLRRLLGDAEIAQALKGDRDRLATFGMYTSRTPYPGESNTEKDRERIGKLLDRLYQGLSSENRELLKKEGKWPAKDIERFIESSFKTSPQDSELLSRQEMQKVCPDLLITNYSMLEYMLLRPIERTIFEQTAQWLSEDRENQLIVVLDEAHMYRGAGGAEVAYLLRRLHSRLGVGRDRIRYILTSASLGSSAQARERIMSFAADLTGLKREVRNFHLITGKIDRKPGERPATRAEAIALAEYDFTSLHRLYEAIVPAEDALSRLFSTLKISFPKESLNESKFRHLIYDFLQQFGPSALTANLITSDPQMLSVIGPRIFPEVENPARPLESLLALMTFAREKEKDRVYAPVRSHLFFRGLPGLFACVNPLCSERVDNEKSSLLGRLFSTPRLYCDCGARVYELLTHRDCGAAFIRGYLKDEYGDFLWHEPSNGLFSNGGVLETHFLVEVDRKSSQAGKAEGTTTWLHIETGQLIPREPDPNETWAFLPLVRPDSPVADGNSHILSFNKECPVCVRSWQGMSKIMDLMTKGEAPFARLVRQSVAMQPCTKKANSQSPNSGRKVLLFSDGRQKAARLARDIPREIEQDVFRQVLFCAAKELKSMNREAVLNKRIYIAFLEALSKTSLQLFDGEDRHILQEEVKKYCEWYGVDIESALEEFDPRTPPRFSASLLRQLGSSFYSVNALTLGFLQPSRTAFRKITDSYKIIEKDLVLKLSIVWIQNFVNRFAFDPALGSGIRLKAAGYPVTTGLNSKDGFSKRQYNFLVQHLGETDTLVAIFSDSLCKAGANGDLFLAPERIKLEVAIDNDWYQCKSCTTVSPVEWWGHCPNCLSSDVTPVQPGKTSYLRARKGLWRDPVVEALNGNESPLNLTVEEHTAQLSYRDIDEPNSTTEEYERRFRDILVKQDDISIDVLSCTTTMEVGIDIGSLVAVGMRNVPPQRQNYQQRAGRAGRRGAAISTVLTYAQNSPHDSHYFENPERIIASEPTLPGVDTKNPKIIERHIHAQIIQSFFQSKGIVGASSNIFNLLGETWEFYVGQGEYSLLSLKNWIRTSSEANKSYQAIRGWLPKDFDRDPAIVAEEFLAALEKRQPNTPEELNQADKNLIEFLFSHGFLPSYAFPRDLCALQIETRNPNKSIKVIQRPQQALNVALSEYAPGRFVVVDKKTYRIGTVAANSTKMEINRAERLFIGRRLYVHCSACLFTAGFLHDRSEGEQCPLCKAGKLSAVSVIQPEVVYPDGGREIDEYDDEQTYTQATGAQLPLPESELPFDFKKFGTNGNIAFARNQSLVMVNKGDERNGDTDGFWVCSLCGKSFLDDKQIGKHERDYFIEMRRGTPPSLTCNGDFEQVYLGYSFASDILLLRMPIHQPFRFDPCDRRSRQPLADALQSLSEALVLGVGRVLDIDTREINAGYRFITLGENYFADIFMYDTLSGGAGYATMAGEVIFEVFAEVESLLDKCVCTSSCDKCLRHYGNRLHHVSLNRLLALDLVKFIKDGQIPEEFNLVRQQTELKPLVQMLHLAGWEITNDGTAPINATRVGRSIELWSYPSLVDPKAIGFKESATAHAFSPYELSKDLPGAFAEIA